MDNKIIFVRTPKGEDEIKRHASNLSGDINRTLQFVDNKSTVDELSRRAAPSLRAVLVDTLSVLEKGGFIQARVPAGSTPAASVKPVDVPNVKMAVPKMAVPKMVTPAAKPESNAGDLDLDFTVVMRAPTPEILAAEAAKSKMHAEAQAAHARTEAEAKARAEEKAKQGTEAAHLKAALETAIAKERLDATKVKAEAEAKARTVADARAKQEAEAKAHMQAEVQAAKQEAEVARIKAEQEAAKMRAEMAATKASMEAGAKAHAEERARQDAEAVRLKGELEKVIAREQSEAAKVKAEAEARALAEAKAKQEAEAKARAQAEAQAALQQAEAARIKAEQEAEMAAAKARMEAETKAHAVEKAKQEAEAVRLKAELEKAIAREQFEAAKAKAEAEARARAEAEAKVKYEAEAKARAQAEAQAAMQQAEAARIRAEQEAAQVKAALEAAKAAESKARAEEKAKQEAEAARLKAEQEAALVKAALEAAKAEAEAKARAEEKAKQEVETARLKAEQEAAQAKAALEAAKVKAEAEARARTEAETRAKQQSEAARIKAEQEAARVRAELEAAKAEARARAESEAKAKREAEAARLKAEQEVSRIKSEAEEQVRQAAVAKADAAAARSMIATVLFFDVVGYTKLSVNKQIELKGQFNKLVSDFIKDIDESQRIILDTGDGAAIGFLQHPEDAIEVAMQFMHAVTANKHQDYPELNVRMGINLGPVNVVKDMNGQINMVGDGINDAQRIMSFAPSDHIYISRSYYDVVSRLTSEYAKLFKYRGVQKDKHGREHQVYEVMEGQKGALAETDTGSFVLNLDSISSALSSAAPPEAEKPVIAQEQTKVAPVTTASAAGSAANPEPVVPPQKIVQKTQAEIEAEARAAEELKAQQEAARIKAEAEERKLAEEQGKVWSAAEQRAKEEAAARAKVEAEHKVQEAERAAQAAKAAQRASKKRGKPLPWGKIGAGLFILLPVLVVLLPYVWPMQSYVAQFEKKLSAQLQQPVHVGRMSAALLPHPKLELQNVAVGGKQELKAATVALNFDMSALFAGSKPIKRVEIGDLTLSAESFEQALSWLRVAGGDAQYPVEHMVLQHARISGEGPSLPAMNGTVDFDGQGHFVKAVLSSEDGKLGVELQPKQSRWQVALTIKDSRLPQLPDILFDELNLKGEVGAGEASFSEIEGRFYRGTLLGNARLSWQQGWNMQGQVNVKALELHDALPQIGVAGEMDGTANFTLRGAKLSQLADAPHLDGSFVMKKGTINNIDMVEAVRSASRQAAAGGRTHFDELSGALQVDNNSQHLRQLKISSGAMSASGQVDVTASKQLSGQLLVNLKMRAGMGSVPLVLSGTLKEPVFRPGR